MSARAARRAQVGISHSRSSPTAMRSPTSLRAASSSSAKRSRTPPARIPSARPGSRRRARPTARRPRISSSGPSAATSSSHDDPAVAELGAEGRCSGPGARQAAGQLHRPSPRASAPANSSRQAFKGEVGGVCSRARRGRAWCRRGSCRSWRAPRRDRGCRAGRSSRARPRLPRRGRTGGGT